MRAVLVAAGVMMMTAGLAWALWTVFAPTVRFRLAVRTIMRTRPVSDEVTRAIFRHYGFTHMNGEEEEGLDLRWPLAVIIIGAVLVAAGVLF
jgi:heme/copper-type cytochrome/quinol oxidase subunit 4